MRQLALIVTLLAALLAATFATPIPAGLRDAAPLPLKARLLTTADFPGYERSRVLTFKRTAAWASAIRFIDAQTLRKLGFVTAAIEDSQPISAQRRGQTSLDSTIVQFRSNAGATLYERTFLSLLPAQYKRFAVLSIPHSYGFAFPQQGGGLYEVGFVDGTFFYDLLAHTIDPTKPPSAAQTREAGTRWYERVRGHPAR